MDYYWLTTAIAILISVIGIVLSTATYPKHKMRKPGRHLPHFRIDSFSLSMILVSIATGLFVKIVADLFYEVINKNFPEYSNITKIVLACVLLVIIVLAYSLRRSAKSRYRKAKIGSKSNLTS